MPGKFETLFAYKLDDCADAEQLIHGIFSKYRENGEWFNITQKEIDLIKANCEAMGGELITDEVINEIETETEAENEPDDEFMDNDEMENEDVAEIEIDPEASINIRGINIPFYKNRNETTQDFVKRVLHLMFNHQLIPETEIQNMLNKQYSVRTFGIPVSILQNDKKRLKDRKGHTRYWTKEIFGNNYYACSQWWKQNAKIYETKLAKWINKIAELNI